MSGDKRETLSKAAQSRGENMMINRACEIFRDARTNIGDDLQGMSLVDLIADNADYPLDACRELAAIVVERCDCSDRLREKYGEGDHVPSRLLELARVAYHGYCVAVDFRSFAGGHINDMPAWDDVPDRVKRGWHGSVVELLLDYQAGTGGVQDPGETIANSEHHFACGEICGLSMRLIRPAGDPGQQPMMIIERDFHAGQMKKGVQRLSLNRDEAKELNRYIRAMVATKLWRD